MNKRTKITTLICTFALVVSSVLSPASVMVQTKAKKPALNKKKITLKLGKTAKLKVKSAAGWKVTWKSKKKKVAKVKKSGKYAAQITAKKKGTAKVVTTLRKGKSKRNLTCKVTVVPANTKTDTSISDNEGKANTSAAPATQSQGDAGATGNAPTVVPTETANDTPTEIPQTEVPTSTPANTTSATSGNQTGEPTKTPAGTAAVTAQTTAKVTPTATAKVTPQATAKATPTAQATAKVTPQTTAKATPTVQATATATQNTVVGENTNAVTGSTVKEPTDASITASVGSAGAVAKFNESSQYKEVKFALASPVSLQNVEKVEFSLTVEGEPSSVSLKLYDSAGSELKMTQYNKGTGTHTVTVPAECKEKTVAMYAIMTNSDIKDTQTATATLKKLTFVTSSEDPVVVPTPTPEPTQKPAATPAPGDEVMTLSAGTYLYSEATDGSPVYNADDSVTVTFTQEYGGGGIAFYFSESKSKVDLSNYTKAVFTLSADAEAPICINAYRSTNYWDGTEDGKAIPLSYTNVATEKKAFSCEFSDLTGVLGFGVKYNTYGKDSSEIPEKLTLTIHSITFVKDMRDITDATQNYISLAELAAEYGLKMGTVMNEQKVKDKKYGDLMKYHFNSITAANEMKAYSMLNESDSKAAYKDETSMPVLQFSGADAIMDFAKTNGLKVRGHALVWDAGMKDWFFRVGYDTSKDYASKEVVKARLKNYIEQVLAHFEEKYPGIIYCWDVVNEAVGDNAAEYASEDIRHVRTMRGDDHNPFYDIIGSDYVELSFQYTYEALQELKNTYSDLDIKLYYNDYNTFEEKKRDAICELVTSINKYKSDGKGGYVKLCDGVGMQSYIGGYGHQEGCMSENDINRVKTAILKYASLGLEVQVTELAVRNYQSDEATMEKHGEFYKKLFQAYLDVNAGEEKPLKAISIWGIVDIPDLPTDDYSYKMNGPFCGLFDENLGVKPSFVNVYNLMKNEQ